MENNKPQQNEERIRQHIVPERVNLEEYAGDAEDDQLACKQANEYIEDCNRRLRISTEQADRRINES